MSHAFDRFIRRFLNEVQPVELPIICLARAMDGRAARSFGCLLQNVALNGLVLLVGRF